MSSSSAEETELTDTAYEFRGRDSQVKQEKQINIDSDTKF